MNEQHLVWKFDNLIRVWELHNLVGNIAIPIFTVTPLESIDYKPSVPLEPTFRHWEGKKDSVIAWVSADSAIGYTTEELNEEIAMETGLPTYLIPTIPETPSVY